MKLENLFFLHLLVLIYFERESGVKNVRPNKEKDFFSVVILSRAGLGLN